MDVKKLGPPKNEWRTPPQILWAIEEAFKVEFAFDPCAASDGNHLTIPEYLTAEDDGLKQPWTTGPAWVNPPYDSKWEWVEKAYNELMVRGIESFVLLESCTDTEQFHKWAQKTDIYLLRPRIKFLGADLKPIGNGFRGSILLHFDKDRDFSIKCLDLTPFVVKVE